MPSAERTTIAALTLLSLTAFPLAALDPSRPVTQYAREAWQTEDGLPQNSVTSLAETPDGYLWLATGEGLARFDGVRFRVFDHAAEPLLPDDSLLSLEVDASGDLIIGTSGGVAIMRGDRFFPGPAELSFPVYATRRASDGSRWFATGKGLYQQKSGAIQKLRDGDFRCLLLERDAVWAAGYGSGMVRVRPNGELRSWTTREGLPSDIVRALVRDRDGRLRIGTQGGLATIDGDTIARDPISASLPHRSVRSMFVDRDENLWVGTEGGLARIIDGSVSVFTRRDGLSDDIVRSFFESSDGSLWVGTLGGGLNRFRDGPVLTWGPPEGLTGRVVRAIATAPDGTIWIGSHDGGLHRIRGGAVRNFGVADGLTNNSIYSLLVEGDVVWLGTSGGLHRLAGERIERIAGPPELETHTIHVIIRLNDRELLVGGPGGLWRCDGKRFERIEKPGSTSINGITRRRDGKFWVATDDDLILWDGAGAWSSTRERERDALRSGANDVAELPGGLEVVATDSAGLLLLRDDVVVRRLGRAEGLPDELVYRVIDDRRGSLWMSCNRGVYSVPLRELDDFARRKIDRVTVLSLGTSHGMRDAECNGGSQPAGALAADGKVWFPTVEGAAVIDPSRVERNRVAPRVYLESVEIDGAKVDPRVDLRLGAGRKSITFRFLAINFASPRATRYRYRLEPTASEWRDNGDTREVSLYIDRAGSYEFTVSACNEHGVWSEKSASFRFTVPPHFWERGIVHAFALGLLFALVYVGYRIRTRALRHRAAELNRVVDERTRELQEAKERVEEANRQLSELSRTDPLTGIANRRLFDDRLDECWRRGIRDRTTLALAIVDVDHFKAFNDHHGHSEGDKCLRSVAACVAFSVHRPDDLVARLGGEEFAILLPSTDAQGALVIAERARSAVESLAQHHGFSPTSPNVTISVGVAAMVPVEERSPAELVETADAALYRAKNAGRNRSDVA